MKKSILLVIDVEGWTFDILASKLKEALNNKYNIDILPGSFFNGNMVKLFLFSNKYDLIHFMWRGYLSLLNNEDMDRYIVSMGFKKNEFYDKFINNKIVTATVCDHLYLNEEEYFRTREILKYVKSYFVTSKKLNEIYENINKEKKYGVINDFVDLNLFKSNVRKASINKNKFIIGWVGNSNFTGPNGEKDLKGVNNILKPAIKQLINEGYNVELKLADSAEKVVPNDDMPSFYNNIDIYVCTSSSEGTPMPVLEAMASGVPIISTDVGIVQEAFGKEQKMFILHERTIIALKEKIKNIIMNPKIYEILSKENLESVKKFSVESISKKYVDFFEYNFENDLNRRKDD